MEEELLQQEEPLMDNYFSHSFIFEWHPQSSSSNQETPEPEVKVMSYSDESCHINAKIHRLNKVCHKGEMLIALKRPDSGTEILSIDLSFTGSEFNELSTDSVHRKYILHNSRNSDQQVEKRVDFKFGLSSLEVEGYVSIGNRRQEQEPNTSFVEQNLSQLQRDMNTMFQEEKFSDIKMYVDGTVFHAHTFILAARSPVFKRLFEPDLTNKRNLGFHMDDMERSVFKEFLAFLYTGCLEVHDTPVVIQLYKAANVYEVETLLSYCRSSLMFHLSEKTIFKVLELADEYKDAILREEATKFLSRHLLTISSREEWQNLMIRNPRLIASLCEDCVQMVNESPNNVFSHKIIL